MKRLYTRMLIALAIAAPQVSMAQEGWQWEFAIDGAAPTQKLGNAKLNTGGGFEGTLSYGFTSNLGAYFGWDWHRFRADTALTGAKADAGETGYVLGVQWQDRFGQTPLNYRLRAGATYNHIEIEDRDGNIITDTKHGAGWELGAALLVPLGGSWQLSPGVRYRSLSRNLTLAGETNRVDLRYVTVGVGITRPF